MEVVVRGDEWEDSEVKGEAHQHPLWQEGDEAGKRPAVLLVIPIASLRGWAPILPWEETTCRTIPYNTCVALKLIVHIIYFSFSIQNEFLI